MTAPVVHSNPETPKGAWASARALVFLGFDLTWQPRLADTKTNLELAESIESDFSRWRVTGRRIEMESDELHYRVELSDGRAQFQCESESGSILAVKHAREAITLLAAGSRSRVSLGVDAQQLLPFERSFEELVTLVENRLLCPQPLQAVNARLFDFNYLVDTRIDGRHFQLNIGPLRNVEVPHKVSASHLEAIPEVSLFCGITTRKRVNFEREDPMANALQSIEIGNTLLAELVP